tara:strand:- start:354 stop:551 length:198 start_codon:yes stop_codon:yes gene_type:complete
MHSNKIKYLKSWIGIRLWPFSSLKIVERMDLCFIRDVWSALIDLTAPFDSSSRNLNAALYIALRT